MSKSSPQESMPTKQTNGSKAHSGPEFGALPTQGRTGEALDPASETSAGAAATLHRVRDLLFGETVRAQENKTAALETLVASEVARVTSIFEARLEGMKSDLKAEMEAHRKEVRGELDEARRRLDGQGRDKVERADLRALLSDLADRVGGPSTESSDER